MIDPTIIPVKRFTVPAQIPVVAIHSALISIMAIAMVVSLPAIG